MQGLAIHIAALTGPSPTPLDAAALVNLIDRFARDARSTRTRPWNDVENDLGTVLLHDLKPKYRERGRPLAWLIAFAFDVAVAKPVATPVVWATIRLCNVAARSDPLGVADLVMHGTQVLKLAVWASEIAVVKPHPSIMKDPIAPFAAMTTALAVNLLTSLPPPCSGKASGCPGCDAQRVQVLLSYTLLVRTQRAPNNALETILELFRTLQHKHTFDVKVSSPHGLGLWNPIDFERDPLAEIRTWIGAKLLVHCVIPTLKHSSNPSSDVMNVFGILFYIFKYLHYGHPNVDPHLHEATCALLEWIVRSTPVNTRAVVRDPPSANRPNDDPFDQDIFPLTERLVKAVARDGDKIRIYLAITALLAQDRAIARSRTRASARLAVGPRVSVVRFATRVLKTLADTGWALVPSPHNDLAVERILGRIREFGSKDSYEGLAHIVRKICPTVVPALLVAKRPRPFDHLDSPKRNCRRSTPVDPLVFPASPPLPPARPPTPDLGPEDPFGLDLSDPFGLDPTFGAEYDELARSEVEHSDLEWLIDPHETEGPDYGLEDPTDVWQQCFDELLG
jgi:hypothetical protein